MKANELMIGDWVIATKNGVSPLPSEVAEMLPRTGKVVGIDGDCVILDFKDFCFMLDGIEPVRLTPEILEKNGWEESKEYEPYIYYLLIGKDYSISLSKEWDSTTKTLYWSLSIGNHGTDAILSIDFIHQLQHAIRLCGIEKEIKL